MSEATKHQGGIAREIPRHFIKMADYNPRKISDYAKNLLRKNIKEMGCVMPLPWNKRTGNLISGHQRLSILDELEGNHDYIIAVREFDVDLKTEMEMNVAANYRGSQGTYDKDPFLAMLQAGDLDLDYAGMTRLDLEYLLGDLPELDGIFAKEAQAAADVVEGLQKIAEVSPFRAEFRKIQKESIEKARNKADNDVDYYIMLVFEPGQLADWMKKNGPDPTVKSLRFDQVRHLVRPVPTSEPTKKKKART